MNDVRRQEIDLLKQRAAEQIKLSERELAVQKSISMQEVE